MKYIVNEKKSMVDVSNKEVIIFGAGYYGKILSYMFQRGNVHVNIVFDNDPRVHDKMVWEKIPCTSPRLIDENIPIIIAIENIETREQIKKQCMELGYLYIYYVDAAELDYCVTMLPDKQFLELKYYLRLGKTLDISSPKTFNEKIQWLKLYDRKPEYHLLVDKYEVKRIIADKIGEEYIIPTLGVWNSFDEIDFEKLPSRFVLKCTHDSNSAVICKDKEIFNRSEAREKLESCRNKDYYKLYREWVYKDIQPRIIAEPYLEDDATHELRDYKFFTFGGKAMVMFVACDRGSSEETKFDFFDMDYIHLPFTSGHPNADIMPEKPKKFKLMIQLAEYLTKGIPHVRVDFYEVNGKVYFGEFTFFHWSGFVPFEPNVWDEKFGGWLELPIEKTI